MLLLQCVTAVFAFDRCRDTFFHIMKLLFHAHGVHSIACYFGIARNV